jgi:acyl-CoA synthetase (AMP-forming)/AMP-acid ligase II
VAITPDVLAGKRQRLRSRRSGPMRLHDILDYQAREHPDAQFAIHGTRELNYREARLETHRLGNAFVTAGLQPGDRVVILAKNSIDYVLLYYAGSRVGVVPVPLNYRLAPLEWVYIVNDAQARMLIAGSEYLAPIDTVRSEFKSVERFIAFGGDSGGWQSYVSWVAAEHSTPTSDRLIADDQVLYQMYTSGTTGRPKGALLTHRAVNASLTQFNLAMDTPLGLRWLLVVPLYHATGALTSFAVASRAGCLYIQHEFNPVEVVRALSEEHIYATTLVPAMIQACLVAVPDVAERRYDHLRLIAYGASPIAEQTLRRAVEVFKCDFLQGYGMTETTAGLTYLLPADHQRALEKNPELLLSAGRPVAGTELRVVEGNDAPVPLGTIGEIIARGPQLMVGYWNQATESAEALRGGWMHTGDAGVMDEEGYVYIQDRVKDMVVSGGENIYPRVVEDVLFQHPAVADAAVIGVPDARWGETVKAIVVLRNGMSTTEEALIEFCRGRLGGFERPRSVDFVDTLPRNPTGKILKRILREKYWSGQTRRVGGS